MDGLLLFPFLFVFAAAANLIACGKFAARSAKEQSRRPKKA